MIKNTAICIKEQTANISRVGYRWKLGVIEVQTWGCYSGRNCHVLSSEIAYVLNIYAVYTGPR